jgi:hypothetical protein
MTVRRRLQVMAQSQSLPPRKDKRCPATVSAQVLPKIPSMANREDDLALWFVSDVPLWHDVRLMGAHRYSPSVDDVSCITRGTGLPPLPVMAD